MADIPRDKPFVWPTWISGLLSGDKSCEWAAWYKAHYKTEKRPEDRESDLSQWRAEHAEMVRVRAARLEQEGYVVTLEHQNKFWLKGATADLSGTPDIVGAKGPLVEIEDCKTGQERESDAWQVKLYMFAWATVHKLDPMTVHGAVAYRHRYRVVRPDEAIAGVPLIGARMRTCGASQPARLVPSEAECRFCDIASCQSRVPETPAAQAETAEF